MDARHQLRKPFRLEYALGGKDLCLGSDSEFAPQVLVDELVGAGGQDDSLRMEPDSGPLSASFSDRHHLGHPPESAVFAHLVNPYCFVVSIEDLFIKLLENIIEHGVASV